MNMKLSLSNVLAEHKEAVEIARDFAVDRESMGWDETDLKMIDALVAMADAIEAQQVASPLSAARDKLAQYGLDTKQTSRLVRMAKIWHDTSNIPDGDTVMVLFHMLTVFAEALGVGEKIDKDAECTECGDTYPVIEAYERAVPGVCFDCIELEVVDRTGVAVPTRRVSPSTYTGF